MDRSSPSPVIELFPPQSPTILDLESPIKSNGYLASKKTDTWSSPAFLKRKRLPSTSIFDTVLDPFLLDDEADNERYVSKKTKFGRKSGEWRYANRSPSPEDHSESHVSDLGPVSNTAIPNGPNIEAAEDEMSNGGVAAIAEELDIETDTAVGTGDLEFQEKDPQRAPEAQPHDKESPYKTQVEELLRGNDEASLPEEDNMSAGSDASFISQANQPPTVASSIVSSPIDRSPEPTPIASDTNIQSQDRIIESENDDIARGEKSLKDDESYGSAGARQSNDETEPKSIVAYPELTRGEPHEEISDGPARPSKEYYVSKEVDVGGNIVQPTESLSTIADTKFDGGHTDYGDVASSLLPITGETGLYVNLEDKLVELEGDDIEDVEYDGDSDEMIEEIASPMPERGDNPFDGEEEWECSGEPLMLQGPAELPHEIGENFGQVSVVQSEDSPIIILSESESEFELDLGNDGERGFELEGGTDEEANYEEDEDQDVVMEDYLEEPLAEGASSPEGSLHLFRSDLHKSSDALSSSTVLAPQVKELSEDESEGEEEYGDSDLADRGEAQGFAIDDRLEGPLQESVEQLEKYEPESLMDDEQNPTEGDKELASSSLDSLNTTSQVQDSLTSQPIPGPVIVEDPEQADDAYEAERILDEESDVASEVEKAEIAESSQIIDLEADEVEDEASQSKESVSFSQTQVVRADRSSADQDFGTQPLDSQMISMPSREISNLDTQTLDIAEPFVPSSEFSLELKEKLSVPFTPEPSGLQAQSDADLEDALEPETIPEPPYEEVKQGQLVTPLATQVTYEPILPPEQLEDTTSESKVEVKADEQTLANDKASQASPSNQLWAEMESSQLDSQTQTHEVVGSSPVPSEPSHDISHTEEVELDIKNVKPTSPAFDASSTIEHVPEKVKSSSPGLVPKTEVQVQTSWTGLRTSLAYFAPLSALSGHFNRTVDVLAVVVDSTTPKQMSSGAMDFHETLFLADRSSSASTSDSPIVLAEIYRPYRRALPFARSGDPILLRNFKVQSRHHNFILISTNTSAWAVLPTDEDAQIRGPPVELGQEERDFAESLSKWWLDLDNTERGTVKSVATELKKPPPKRQSTKKEANKPKESQIDPTESLDESSEAELSQHILRDGTTYPNSSSQDPTPVKKAAAKSITTDESSADELATDGRRKLRHGRSYADSPPVKRPGRKYTAKKHHNEVEELLEDSHGEDSVVIGKHELRDGTTYVDEGPQDTVDVHRLRNGTAYRDRQ